MEKQENYTTPNETQGEDEVLSKSSENKESKQMDLGNPFSSMLLLIVVVSSLFGAIFGYFGGALGKGSSLDGDDRMRSERSSLSTQSIISEDTAVIDVVEKSSPAVVSIVISKNVTNFRSFGLPFGFDFFGEDMNPGQNEKQQVGGGSGFFASDDGMIVTNKHVVDDPTAEYTVMTNDGKEFPAKVLARDPVHDIAIIKIEGTNFPVLQLGDSDSLKIGQSVIAIGNSLGEFSNTVSRGIISGLGRNVTAGSEIGGDAERLSNIIQTDAAINPGNSGGPLIDISGNVVGVNVAMAQGAQNIGFALPMNQVKKTIEQVKQTGKITAPFLGVRYQPIDVAVQKANSLPFDYGVIVRQGTSPSELAVIPGSPADRAGIVENDIILEVDGVKIDKKNQLADLIAKRNVGDSATVKVWRRGETKDVKITLQERK